MADMEAYPAYLLRQVIEHLGDRVWEIGVGNGQSIRNLLRTGRHVLGTDIDVECLRNVVSSVRNDRPEQSAHLQTACVDLENPETIQAQRDFRANSILCMNVLEHIASEVAALEALRCTVSSPATLALIVRAHPRLFGRMDREAGHHRRYTRRSLASVLHASGWEILKCRYINALGGVGWWLHNRLRRNAGLHDPHVNSQMRMADRWLPRVARCTDPITGLAFGLSVVAIARVRDRPESGSC